jgi:hypothetical protein
MASLTPTLTSTPGAAPNYNVGMAETFSWVPVEGAGRPLFARATYMTNASDMSVSLSANSLNINLEDVENLLKAQLGQSGFVFVTPADGTVSGPFTTFQVVSACKIASMNATNSTVGSLTSFELPINFSFNGPIQSVSLQYGAAILYKL